MNKIILLFLAISSFSIISSAGEITEEQKQQLITSFNDAYNSKNADAFKKLYYLQGTSSEAKRRISFTARALFRDSVEHVYLTDDIPESRRGIAQMDGKDIDYNLKPVGCLIAEVPHPKHPDKKGMRAFVYAEKDEKLYFIERSEVGYSWAGPDDIFLGVLITSQSPTKQPMLNGYIIYNESGNDKKISFEKEGGYSWNFYGQYIKEVVINKLDDNGSTQLELIKKADSGNMKTTYKSESISEASQIVYKRKE